MTELNAQHGFMLDFRNFHDYFFPLHHMKMDCCSIFCFFESLIIPLSCLLLDAIGIIKLPLKEIESQQALFRFFSLTQTVLL